MQNILNMFKNAPAKIKFITLYNIICVLLVILTVTFRASFNQTILFIFMSLVLLIVNYFLLKKQEFAFYLMLIWYGIQFVYFEFPGLGFAYGISTYLLKIDTVAINFLPIIMFFILISAKEYIQVDTKQFIAFDLVFALILISSVFLFASQGFRFQVAAGKYIRGDNNQTYIKLNSDGSIIIKEVEPYPFNNNLFKERGGVLEGRYSISHNGSLYIDIPGEVGFFRINEYLTLKGERIEGYPSHLFWIKQK